MNLRPMERDVARVISSSTDVLLGPSMFREVSLYSQALMNDMKSTYILFPSKNNTPVLLEGIKYSQTINDAIMANIDSVLQFKQDLIEDNLSLSFQSISPYHVDTKGPKYINDFHSFIASTLVDIEVILCFGEEARNEMELNFAINELILLPTSFSESSIRELNRLRKYKNSSNLKKAHDYLGKFVKDKISDLKARDLAAPKKSIFELTVQREICPEELADSITHAFKTLIICSVKYIWPQISNLIMDISMDIRAYKILLFEQKRLVKKYGNSLTRKVIDEMKYLEASFLESIRLSGESKYLRISERDIFLSNGSKIKKSSFVKFSTFCYNHDISIHGSNPYVFWPERHLLPSTDSSVKAIPQPRLVDFGTSLSDNGNNNSVAKIAIIALAGLYFAKTKVLNKGSLRALSVINVSLLTPCMIYSKIVQSLDGHTLLQLWTAPVLYIIFGILSCVWVLVSSRVLGINKNYQRLLVVAVTFTNINSLPYSIVQSILSTTASSFMFKDPNDSFANMVARGTIYIIIFITLNNLFQWSLGVLILGTSSKPAKPKLSNSDSNTSCSETDNLMFEDLSNLNKNFIGHVDPDQPNLDPLCPANFLNHVPAGHLSINNTSNDVSVNRNTYSGNEENNLSGADHQRRLQSETSVCEKYEIQERDISYSLQRNQEIPEKLPQNIFSKDIPNEPDSANLKNKENRAFAFFKSTIISTLQALKVVLTPPVLAVILGVATIIIPSIKDAFLDHNNPLNIVFSAVSQCGDAFLPISIIALGGQLGLTSESSSSKENLSLSVVLKNTKTFLLNPCATFKKILPCCGPPDLSIDINNPSKTNYGTDGTNKKDISTSGTPTETEYPCSSGLTPTGYGNPNPNQKTKAPYHSLDIDSTSNNTHTRNTQYNSPQVDIQHTTFPLPNHESLQPESCQTQYPHTVTRQDSLPNQTTHSKKICALFKHQTSADLGTEKKLIPLPAKDCNHSENHQSESSSRSVSKKDSTHSCQQNSNTLQITSNDKYSSSVHSLYDPNNPDYLTKREERLGIIVVLTGRYLFVPICSLGVLLVCKNYLRSAFKLVANDPVYFFTILLICSAPPAINLINLAQFVKRFENQIAKILLYSYIIGMLTISAEVAFFMWFIDRVY
ncbi:hypothetical protein BB560_002767 [Smittium megazygosporum]|uniref:Transporter n=1 Tax=Smittium megazygosporum TaxID=133381 RepID=A0A2T9ZDZ8_9FUNG|nr:hypothetical protein BB560_002767 [Smittium megazygosporum]